MTTYVTDSQWFRSQDGLCVLAGSPLTQFSVTKKGAEILDALENKTPLPLGHEPLSRRLLAKGAIHPVCDTHAHLTDVTVVIPAFIDNAADLALLQDLVYALRGIHVVVVDDASPQEIHLAGAIVIRHTINTGPAGARNTGAQHVQTPFVVFVDTDVRITTDSISRMIAHFSLPETHCVAPRVTSKPGAGRINSYEELRSSLDLGTMPAVVQPTSRVSYVPSACLAVRVNTFHALGGFDESLRVGEDVDFVWRLAATDMVCRYDPHITCTHKPRASFGALLRQRFSYGSSAAALDQRHPHCVAPLRSHLLLVLPPLLLFSGFFIAAVITAVFAVVWFLVTLRATQLSVGNRLRIIKMGAQSGATLLMSAIARTWWPVGALASVMYAPTFLLFTISVFAPPLLRVATQRLRYPVSFVAFTIADNFAYGLGVWQGAVRQRSLRCLWPAITLRSGRLRSKG